MVNYMDRSKRWILLAKINSITKWGQAKHRSFHLSCLPAECILSWNSQCWQMLHQSSRLEPCQWVSTAPEDYERPWIHCTLSQRLIWTHWGAYPHHQHQLWGLLIVFRNLTSSKDNYMTSKTSTAEKKAAYTWKQHWQVVDISCSKDLGQDFPISV